MSPCEDGTECAVATRRAQLVHRVVGAPSPFSARPRTHHVQHGRVYVHGYNMRSRRRVQSHAAPVQSPHHAHERYGYGYVMVFAEVWCLSRADLSDGANINGIMGESCGEYVRAAARVYDPSRVERAPASTLLDRRESGSVRHASGSSRPGFPLLAGSRYALHGSASFGGGTGTALARPNRCRCARLRARRTRVCQAHPTSLLPSARTHLVAT